MQKTDEYIAKRLKWKAGKNSLPTQHSFLFESLPTENQKYYSELFKSQNIGIPVLVFTQPENDKWTIIVAQLESVKSLKSKSLFFVKNNIKASIADVLPLLFAPTKTVSFSATSILQFLSFLKF
ncbi:hypothetical protein DFQ10_1081 [Winogradskyella eximia]|uniref:Uncharacterized protein n=1 Tax=Winogradskyella eximia TaxID=262006 RepID=A0A3D9GZD8_9FLAO|nr:hypothetical protein DFQ10_1081 [Winogradskyella eximia]